MLRWLDSFDHYPSGSLAHKYSVVSSPTIGAGRFGSGLYLEHESYYVRKNFDNRPTWTVGAAMLVAPAPRRQQWTAMALVDNTTPQVELRMTEGGILSVTHNGSTLGTAAEPCPLNQWLFVEMKATVHPTDGEVIVRVNEVPVLRLSGVNTRATANAWANAVRLGGGDSQYIDVFCYFDDLYILDDQPGLTDFLGDCRVACLYVNGGGGLWLPSTGAGWQCIDEPLANGDTDYVEADAVGTADVFTLTDPPIVAGQVYGAAVHAQARKTDAGTRQLALILGGSEGPGQVLFDSTKILSEVREAGTGGVPETVAGLAGLTAGIKVAA